MNKNEAIEVLKKYQYDPEVREALECLHPELKESEDERIRNFLIGKFREIGEVWHEYSTKDIIAWLERIDSQNLANSAKTCKDEQKSFDDTQEYLKGVDRVQNYEELTKFEKGFDRIADTYAHNKNKDGYNKPWYTKERAAEMLYWAKEELGLLNVQNPAWSEEDAINFNLVYTYVPDEELRTWLKSLKERYTWKPSDEQLHYLSWVANIKLGDGVVEQEVSKHLNKLYDDLKKLKG